MTSAIGQGRLHAHLTLWELYLKDYGIEDPHDDDDNDPWEDHANDMEAEHAEKRAAAVKAKVLARPSDENPKETPWTNPRKTKPGGRRRR